MHGKTTNDASLIKSKWAGTAENLLEQNEETCPRIWASQKWHPMQKYYIYVRFIQAFTTTLHILTLVFFIVCLLCMMCCVSEHGLAFWGEGDIAEYNKYHMFFDEDVTITTSKTWHCPLKILDLCLVKLLWVQQEDRTALSIILSTWFRCQGLGVCRIFTTLSAKEAYENRCTCTQQGGCSYVTTPS